MIIIVVWIGFYFYIPQSILIFKESTKEVLNPGRGFYVQINSNEDERFKELKNDNIKIALVAYDIEDYINTLLDKEKLQELEIVLGKARDYGIKIVFRAAYGFDPNYEDPETVDIIYSHIKQIAPILNKYSDVILSVQAGFIGPWGEWHSSKYFTGDSEEVTLRNTLLSALLEYLDEEIVINVRRPRFIRDAIEVGMDGSRLGLHNDALLSTKNDMGTYDDPDYTRKEELAWAKSNIAYGVNGGEMPLVSEYSAINNAVEEMRSLQLTYLNSRYNKEVLEEWKNTEYKGHNGFQYIKNHLGYRLWLGEVNLSTYIRPYRTLKLKMKLHNSGFAPVKKGNELFLVIKRGNEIIFEGLLEDELSLLKGGSSKEFIIHTRFNNLLKNNNDDLLLGIYIANNTYEELQGLNNSIKQIQLANSDIIYKNGINYFASYKYDNENNQYKIWDTVPVPIFQTEGNEK